MSFFAELKRRNVFKVGVAYLISAWLLIQVADILLDNIGTPAWVLQTIFVVLGVGFFITLFFAWAFEMTPEGVKREKDIDRTQSITNVTGQKLNNAIIGVLVLALTYFAIDKFILNPGKAQPDSENFSQQTARNTTEVSEKKDLTPVETTVDAEPAISRQSIAVLPFANRSRQEDDEFFVEGMHDDLLTNLARIGALKVISRTSVLRYKDTELPIPEIAKELGVATIMEGAVQRSGSTVRINVQLIDATTDEHLWAEIFDRELTAENLFAIQSEISEKIASALETTLSPQEQLAISERPTQSLAAYNAYLLGRQLMARRSTEDLTRAQAEFQRATELDPEFALAWVGIAETTYLLAGNTRLSFPETMVMIENAAHKALAINPQLGEAYLSLAQAESFEERHEAAESNYRKAIDLSPGYATAFQWYSEFLARSPHRLREALDMLRKAEELDPMSPVIQNEIARQLILLGRFDDAENQLKTLIRKNPDFAPGYREMASLMSTIGRFDEQAIWVRKAIALDPGNFGLYLQQAFAVLNIGDEDALAEIKNQMAALDARHWSTGWLETLESIKQKNYAAALESARWVDKQIGEIPQFQNVYGFVYALNNDFQKARQAFAIAYPKFFDRSTWRAAIELSPGDGCFMAYIMSRSGENELSADLLKMTLSYLENELPNYIEHADRYGYDSCYLMTGDNDKAMDQLETAFEHGHYGAWWIWTNFSLYEPLRGTDRFEAMMQEILATGTTQRANLARMELEAGA
jgi:TolB-like protein/cytochrome c-type biogenesis protein CcmH/NrfG